MSSPDFFVLSKCEKCRLDNSLHLTKKLEIGRRKFDIRTYVLMTSINGNTKVYIYEEGYLRTSCREYSV
jgi:hypothetical protein